MKIRDLNGKKCLITGAASGIGRSTAIALARKGARLVLTDINGINLQETAMMIQDSGGDVLFWKALDISIFNEVKNFSEDVASKYGAMDIILNIAGTSIWGSVELLEHEHWKKMVDINLMGPVHVIESFIPGMVKAGRGGFLVNVSSAAGLIALPWHAAYSASKFGLVGVSEVMRYELMRYGIGVSVVCPGAVKTPLVETALVLGIDRNHAEARKFLKRFEDRAVTPEDVASCILKGIRKNRFLVTTSLDIRMLYWLKMKFFPGYRIILILLNRMMMNVYEKTKIGSEGAIV